MGKVMTSSSTEVEVQRRARNGGKGGHHRREEPTSLTSLQATGIPNVGEI